MDIREDLIMPSIKNWQHGAVVQRDHELGCIPTGIEWMIRVSGIEGVLLENFQEKYNLQRSGIAPNSFDNIAKAVNQDYPQVHIQFRAFIHGEEKVAFILNLLENGTPSILSLALSPKGGWHIMPVIEFKNGIFCLLNRITQAGIVEICEIDKFELIRRHDKWPGGNDVAWLELDHQ